MSYKPKKVKVAGVKKLTDDTVLLRINKQMSYEPGQFAQLSILGIGECPVSFCSYSKDYIEFAIRNVGSLTKNLCNLKKGSDIWIRGPFGKGFPLKQAVGKHIVVVGGGTGVAPLRGIIEYANKNIKFPSVKIFFGFRGYEEIMFKKEFEKWKRTCNLNICLDKPCKEYKCFAGFVTDLVKQADLDKESIAFVCGPPVMTKFAVENLLKKGIKQENIFVSLERLMHCGIGKCGHCMINDKYVCKDGPVFNWSIAKGLRD